ncbi:MAG: L,D-transpeptidase family protein [Rhodocyclaceae bacterium]|nr:L,D-transpeptidase family protein [Rhodocyclaceae bacterium]MBP6278448.1 L,D-transpeptidase family protein [Rhodocyclaceae bacterium]
MSALRFSFSATVMRAAAGVTVVVAALAAWAMLPKPERLAQTTLANHRPAGDDGTSLSNGELEAQLASVFDKIESNRLDLAMRQTDTLLASYPNFRLGHLIRGDLLLARTRPLETFGDVGSNLAAEKVADLRDEAMARLKAYRAKPPVDYVPRYLMQMHAEQRYAMVVDTQKSRLYLYQNDNGTPKFVADYYISQGKLGADKVREGDRKTPIGVYHVTSSLPRSGLADLYGSGAYPLNYPNAWDKQHGRDGHGIWLHGTPSDTYSRPPKASDGCVVLANQDLDALAKTLQVGLTPVIISNNIEWLSHDDWQQERDSLLAVIDAWRMSWENRDDAHYAENYATDFLSDGQSRAAWLARKQTVNAGKTWIKVGVNNISMFRNPGAEDYVVVTFDQNYRSSNLSGSMKKRQYWIKESGRWKIVKEDAV